MIDFGAASYDLTHQTPYACRFQRGKSDGSRCRWSFVWKGSRSLIRGRSSSMVCATTIPVAKGMQHIQRFVEQTTDSTMDAS